MGSFKKIVRYSPTSASFHSRFRPSQALIGLIALGIVYLVWGSTYLAIRNAVRGEGALPPFALGALRMGLASAFLYAIAAARGERLRLRGRQLVRSASAGLLLWLGGNGLVILSLTRIDTGTAAVLMATTPLWLALIVALRKRKLPSVRSGLGVVFGFAGVIVLVVGQSGVAGSIDGLGVVFVLVAALCWALGSLVPPATSSPLVNAASVLWFACIGFAFASAVSGETLVMPSPRALLALGYLVFVGTAIGFGAYLICVARLPMGLVMTHASVNPLVAVILGFFFAGESLTFGTIAAAALIVTSIPLSK